MWLVGGFDLLVLFAVTFIGLGVPPTGYMQLLAVIFHDFLDGGLGYAQLFGDLGTNAIELGGYGQLCVASLNLGDLLHCGDKRRGRRNLFTLRLRWRLRFWRFGLRCAGLAAMTWSIRTSFTLLCRAWTAIGPSSHGLARARLYRIRYAHTAADTIGGRIAIAAIAALAAIVAIASRSPVIPVATCSTFVTITPWLALIAIASGSSIAAAIWLTPVVAWCGGRR